MSVSGISDFHKWSGSGYAKFRPDYSDSVFHEIIKRHHGKRELAIDVGAGTGQASVPLTKYFNKVIAYDPSPGQLEQSVKANNLEYIQSIAEKIPLPDKCVDLLVSAQAVHWFNFDQFFNETKRLLRPGGLLALWCYSLCSVTNNEEADHILKEYYKIVRPYFEEGRKYIDNHYIDIVPPYPNVERISLSMPKEVTRESFVGYLETFSGLNNWRKKYPNSTDDPHTKAATMLCSIFKEGEIVKLSFPVSMIFSQQSKE